jgi:hypothetical protein
MRKTISVEEAGFVLSGHIFGRRLFDPFGLATPQHDVSTNRWTRAPWQTKVCLLGTSLDQNLIRRSLMKLGFSFLALVCACAVACGEAFRADEERNDGGPDASAAGGAGGTSATTSTSTTGSGGDDGGSTGTSTTQGTGTAGSSTSASGGRGGGGGLGGNAGTSGAGGIGPVDGGRDGAQGDAAADRAITPPTGFSVLYRAVDAKAMAVLIHADLTIANAGPETVSLADLTVRYYFTNEVLGPPMVDVLVARLNPGDQELGGNVTDKVVRMQIPTPTANNYVELGFGSDAGHIAPGQSALLTWVYHDENFSQLTQTNDYSFDRTKISSAPWDHVVLLHKGTILWGTSP